MRADSNKKNWLILFCALTCLHLGAAGVADDRVALIQDNFEGPVLLGKYAYKADVPAEMVPDWTEVSSRVVNDVGDPASPFIAETASLRFEKNEENSIMLHSQSAYTWVIFELENASDVATDAFVEVAGIVAFGYNYRDANGTLIAHSDDATKPLLGRAVFDTRPVIPIRLEPHQRYRVNVLAFAPPALARLNLKLFSGEAFRQLRVGEYLFDGVYFGLVIALIAYNLSLFVALRQWTYLFFSLFVAATALTVYLGSGLSSLYGLRDNLQFTIPAYLVSLILISCFGTMFNASLLDMWNTNRRLFWFWMAPVPLIAVIGVFSVGLALGNGTLPREASGPLFLVLATFVVYGQCLTVYSLIYYWNRSPIAKYWFIGISLHATSVVGWAALNFTTTEIGIEPRYLAQAAILLVTIILSGLIAYNLRIERNRSRHAQQSAVESLRYAHDLERAKSNFIATVGHDLHGPVQAIGFLAQSLKASLAGEERSRIEKIEENVGTTSEMLRSLVQLSQAESRRTRPSVEAVSISKLLSVLRSEFEITATQKNLNLKFDTTQGVIYSDRVILSQILRNLIDNAIKYTDEGGIEVRVTETAEAVKVAVNDTGKGISQSEIGNIFDEFYQVRDENQASSGVGLGLSIVARLTKLLGIEVTVRSSPGVGSSFELLIEKGAAISGEQDAASANDGASSLRGMCALVCSESNVVDRFEGLLTSWGVEIHRFKDAHEAILSMAQAGWQADLVLTDENGYEAMLSIDLISTLLSETPILIGGVEGSDEIARRYEGRPTVTVLDTSIEPMRFRSLIQRQVWPRFVAAAEAE